MRLLRGATTRDRHPSRQRAIITSNTAVKTMRQTFARTNSGSTKKSFSSTHKSYRDRSRRRKTARNMLADLSPCECGCSLQVIGKNSGYATHGGRCFLRPSGNLERSAYKRSRLNWERLTVQLCPERDRRWRGSQSRPRHHPSISGRGSVALFRKSR